VGAFATAVDSNTQGDVVVDRHAETRPQTHAAEFSVHKPAFAIGQATGPCRAGTAQQERGNDRNIRDSQFHDFSLDNGRLDKVGIS